MEEDEEGDFQKVVTVCSEESILQKASKEIEQIISSRTTNNDALVEEKPTAHSLLRARLQDQVRTGEITPFQKQRSEIADKKNNGVYKESSEFLQLEKYLMDQAKLAKQKKLLKQNKAIKENEKKRKLSEVSVEDHNKNKKISPKKKRKKTPDPEVQKKVDVPHESKSKKSADDGSDSEYLPSECDYDSESSTGSAKASKATTSKKKSSNKNKKVLDDGDDDIYEARMEMQKFNKKEPMHTVEGHFKVPKSIWKKLFKYQRVSVHWLWELHTRNLGGILGDEMGLGKTVQLIAFLAGLDCSELLSDSGRFRGLGPTLIVCPATLMEQWVKHFHEWWPVLRCIMLHQSSTFQGDVKDILATIRGGGIMITSYTGMVIHQEELLRMKWHYVILDEGHKIRNPDAKVSKVVKRVLTPHRILLSGSPMQNSLKELWSLFDFVLPGKLGTLPVFMEHCANPITKGGYANASRLQEATALQVATMLKNTITPYLLRRTKNDVQHHVALPEKNEQVLFCSLTEEQKELYTNFLRSDEVSYVIHERHESGRYRAKLLVALSTLRKICNHPDLYLYGTLEAESDEDVSIDQNSMDNFGYWKRSGKMAVVHSLLKIWKKQGHRVLLFTQSRQMMYILELLLQQEKHNYLRLDGTTLVNQRQTIISKFNKDPSYFVFLATTRVGGLGVNLTGANRVIIYDPDWNPATDAQARERAWRIGQEKNVTIYRLITAGTVEEKIYHRQIFKILLSNRVLEDPRQKRLFHTTDLRELFNLSEPLNGDATESDRLFQDSKLTVPKPGKFSSNKVEAMRKLAAALSKKIAEKKINNESTNNENCDTSSNVSAQIGETSSATKDSEQPSTSKKKKHKRKKSKNVEQENTVSALFEGEKISYLIGQRLPNSNNTEDVQIDDDQYVLSKLFSKAGVNSAFQHDSVLSNASLMSGQETLLERAAKTAATESMSEVKESRKWCWRPSWNDDPDDE